jgi:hypothetical protein
MRFVMKIGKPANMDIMKIIPNVGVIIGTPSKIYS